MKDQIRFDVTDASTISDSDSVGAFVRAGVDGDLIDSENINSLERLSVDSTLKDGAGTALTSTLVGSDQSLDVNITDSPDQYAEDSAHVSGDIGSFALAVRNDAGTPLAADQDYIPFTTDSSGNLRVAVTGGGDDALADTAIANAANALAVADTAEDVVSSPLADRKYLFIYNNGNRTSYLGATGVSAASGFPLSPGSRIDFRAGDSIDIEWVSANTSQELRTLELS